MCNYGSEFEVKVTVNEYVKIVFRASLSLSKVGRFTSNVKRRPNLSRLHWAACMVEYIYHVKMLLFCDICQSVYSVSQKSPLQFSDIFFPNGREFLIIFYTPIIRSFLH